MTKIQELSEYIGQLRKRVFQYRLEKEDMERASVHVNAVDIVLSLAELGIREKRQISKEEELWFRADLYLSYVFDNSEWKDIARDFSRIASMVEDLKYFR